jgi:hypothetical protein
VLVRVFIVVIMIFVTLFDVVSVRGVLRRGCVFAGIREMLLLYLRLLLLHLRIRGGRGVFLWVGKVLLHHLGHLLCCLLLHVHLLRRVLLALLCKEHT